MEQRTGLSDPRAARFAWHRFRRILWYMNLAAIACGSVSVGIIWINSGTLPLIFAILTFAGIYLTILMASALMGLMFLSNGTGHDDDVMDFAEEAHPIDD
jgi:hypothetical protein